MALPDWQPGLSLDRLKLRARVKDALRRTLTQWNVLEVDPPCLVAAADFEPHIDCFRTRLAHGGGNLALHSSPELMMKRLLAAGSGSIYFLGPVFRNSEIGARHNPEFGMLEWYRLDRNLDQAIEDTLALIGNAAQAAQRSMPPVHRTTYHALFHAHTGLDPHRADRAALKNWALARSIDVAAPDELDRDDWLDLIIGSVIEPRLPRDQLLVVRDFPASQAALARTSTVEINGQLQTVAARFEVYGGGLELANGYHELADVDEQRRRFAAEADLRRQENRPEPVIDPRFTAALAAGLPDCCGVAMGFDRLMMWLLGSDRLDAVMPFTIDRVLL